MSENHPEQSAPLFNEFEATSKQEWLAITNGELKDNKYENLIWSPENSLNVEPYYTLDESSSLEFLKSYYHHTQKDLSRRDWSKICPVQLNHFNRKNEALGYSKKLIEIGADGFFITIDSQVEWQRHLVIELSKTYPKSYFFFEDLNVSHPLASFQFQKHGSGSASRGGVSVPIKNISDFKIPDPDHIAPCLHLKNFLSLGIPDAYNLEEKYPDTTELALCLSIVVEIIDRYTERDYVLENIISNIWFQKKINQSFFLEIAKLKALRVLFHSMICQYPGVEYQPENLFIQAITYPENNEFDTGYKLLKNINSTLAAILGGANSICNFSPNLKTEPDNLNEQRIRLNNSYLLQYESFLDKVIDPLAGAYYIDQLVNALSREAWKKFQEIEAQGGLKAFSKDLKAL